MAYIVNYSKQIEYGKKFTYDEIKSQIEEEKKKLVKFENKFNSNPNKKTATNLSNSRQKIEFLEVSLEYTEKAIRIINEYERKESEQIREFILELKNNI